MSSQSSDWQAELAQALAKCAGVSLETASHSLLPPSTPVCDWCSNLAFSEAKQQKTAPAKLAAEWAAKKEWPSFVQKAEAVGPYLNFHFSSSFWSALVHSSISDARWGLLPNLPLKALIEFPSVNPNKPWHVGHLRNAVLGDSLARLLSAAGRTTERMDYIDDLGLQVAQSVWGEMQKNSGADTAASSSPFSQKFDHVLGRKYVWVAGQIDKAHVDNEVRAIVKQMEEGREPIASQARALVENCVKAQYETAFSYGIYHDVLIFESDIVRTVFQEGLEKIKASGAAVMETEGKNAHCLVVKLQGEPGFEGMENADKILIRSDGTATYTGKDVAFQMWKFGLLNDTFVYSPLLVQPNRQTAYMSSNSKKQGEGPAPSHQPVSSYPMPFARAQTVINVIGAEQAYPQKVIAAVMRKMGHEEEASACIHLAYEHVVLPEGRFSGRKGTWMSKSAQGAGDSGPASAGGLPSSLGFTADELLDEMNRLALEQIKAEYSDAEKQSISKAVAVAAIRFWFLRPNAGQKITFDYERALSFSGDSGPYVQYAYARASRILEKGQEAGLAPSAPGADYALNEKELALARLLMRWPQILEASASKHQIHPIADFTLEAAGKFNEFYTTTPVLSDEVSPAQKAARLAEVAAARALIGRGMDILGLPKLEKM
ncbi:Arginine--tRNA ligase [uncultured archaeon]|nr:Arginine--tRNA ligase [uncultured archaeon]